MKMSREGGKRFFMEKFDKSKVNLIKVTWYCTMHISKTFSLEKQLTICCLLSIPAVVMIACWIAMFLNPALGFSET